MADPDNPAIGPSPRGRRIEPSQRDLRDLQRAAARGCSECASPTLNLVSEGDVVSIYRCPACGHLSAPVKERQGT